MCVSVSSYECSDELLKNVLTYVCMYVCVCVCVCVCFDMMRVKVYVCTYKSNVLGCTY